MLQAGESRRHTSCSQVLGMSINNKVSGLFVHGITITKGRQWICDRVLYPEYCHSVRGQRIAVQQDDMTHAQPRGLKTCIGKQSRRTAVQHKPQIVRLTRMTIAIVGHPIINALTQIFGNRRELALANNLDNLMNAQVIEEPVAG